MNEIDNEQSRRIRNVEDRLNELENQFSAITAKLDILQQLCKGLMVLAGVALGVDVIPIMGGI